MEENVKEVVNKLGIKAKAEYGAKKIPESFENCDPWTVTLTNKEGRRMTIPFFKGVGHHGAAPTAEEVLECLAADSAGCENTSSLEEWCAEYGYDTDSRKANSIYEACQRTAKRLKQFLGEDNYNALLWGK